MNKFGISKPIAALLGAAIILVLVYVLTGGSIAATFVVGIVLFIIGFATLMPDQVGSSDEEVTSNKTAKVEIKDNPGTIMLLYIIFVWQVIGGIAFTLIIRSALDISDAGDSGSEYVGLAGIFYYTMLVTLPTLILLIFLGINHLRSKKNLTHEAYVREGRALFYNWILVLAGRYIAYALAYNL